MVTDIWINVNHLLFLLLRVVIRSQHLNLDESGTPNAVDVLPGDFTEITVCEIFN